MARRRRTRYPNIWRDGKTGTRYEITFVGSDGRRRWKTLPVGTTITRARDVLAEVQAKLARGQLVAPSDVSFEEFTRVWFEDNRHKLRPRTQAIYETGLRVHIYPRIGKLRLVQITPDRLARLISEMEKDGKAGSTIKNALAPARRALTSAVRRGLIATNPFDLLERSERPRASKRPVRVLSEAEMAAFMAAVPHRYRALMATLLFTGMRQAELFGLRWRDVRFGEGVIRVEGQMTRERQRVAYGKTERASREIVMMPSLARVLREHRDAGTVLDLDGLVFSTLDGGPLDHRNVRNRGFYAALKAAGLDRSGLRLHDLRHCFASILIAQGADVVFVSRQMGHSSPVVTLAIYAHLFESVRQADSARAELEHRFGALL